MRKVRLTLLIVVALMAAYFGYSKIWELRNPELAKVNRLIRQLKSPDPVERCRAVVALRYMGEKAAPAVTQLIAMLDDDTRVAPNPMPVMTSQIDQPTTPANEAVGALVEIGQPAIGPAIAAYRRSARIRANAVAVIGGATACSNTKDKTALAVLCEAAEDESQEVRLIAVESLAHVPDARVAVLVQRMMDPNQNVRLQAIYSLSEYRHTYPEIPVLVAKLKHPNARERKAAVNVLSSLPRDFYDNKLILRMLNDKSERVREAAAYSLGYTGGWGAVESLISKLDDDSRDVRRLVAMSLTNITGRDFGQNKDKWQQWWNKERPFINLRTQR